MYVCVYICMRVFTIYYGGTYRDLYANFFIYPLFVCEGGLRVVRAFMPIESNNENFQNITQGCKLSELDLKEKGRKIMHYAYFKTNFKYTLHSNMHLFHYRK